MIFNRRRIDRFNLVRSSHESAIHVAAFCLQSFATDKFLGLDRAHIRQAHERRFCIVLYAHQRCGMRRLLESFSNDDAEMLPDPIDIVVLQRHTRFARRAVFRQIV